MTQQSATRAAGLRLAAFGVGLGVEGILRSRCGLVRGGRHVRGRTQHSLLVTPHRGLVQ